MTRFSVLGIYDKIGEIAVVASKEVNGGISLLDTVKVFQDKVYFSDPNAEPDRYFYEKFMEMMEKHPRKETYPYSMIFTTGYIQDSENYNLVLHCPVDSMHFVPDNETIEMIERITSEIIIIVNLSNKAVRIDEYMGDYVTVNPDEIMLFDGTVDSVICKIH